MIRFLYLKTYTLIILTFMNCLSSLSAEIKLQQSSEEKTFVMVALPCRHGLPLDSHWYTESYVDYIRSLLPSKQYEVEGYFVSLKNIEGFIQSAKQLSHQKKKMIVLNMCDGGEWDNYPGISLLSAWEKDPISKKIPLTGGSFEFILNSDDKIIMNQWMKKGGLNWLPQIAVTPEMISSLSLKQLIEHAHLDKSWPLFVKLNVGAGALGINETSICHTQEALEKKIKEMHQAYPTSNLLIQPYLPGKEYTVLVIKDKVFMAVERIYHNKHNIMLDEYLTGLRPPEEEITYAPVPKPIQDIALKAVHAIPGKHHYTRVDLRSDREGHIYVIDINDRPGFGEPSSINTMLKYHHLSDALFIQEILQGANTCD